MSLQLSRLDATRLATPYAGWSLATAYLRIENLAFNFRQNTLTYDVAVYATKTGMAVNATLSDSVPVPELAGLNTCKTALTPTEQTGSLSNLAYEHLKAQLAAVAGAPYQVIEF